MLIYSSVCTLPVEDRWYFTKAVGEVMKDTDGEGAGGTLRGVSCWRGYE